MPADAFILTHEGYPCLIYSDYEDWLDKNKLNTLISIRNNKVSATKSYLYANNDE